MSDLRELYQEVILDHYRNPRNFRRIEGDCCRRAEGHNPLCGDHVEVQVELVDGVVNQAAFQGTGCAITLASASIMTETVQGRAEPDINEIFEKFQKMVTGSGDGEEAEELGKLAVFEGVKEFPTRVKCAVLPWHTMNAAIEGDSEKVTTE